MPENYCNSQCKTVWDEARQEAKSWFDYKGMACTILMILSFFFFNLVQGDDILFRWWYDSRGMKDIAKS